MYITRKHISRRAILRGTGAALALPFLDAMVPAQTPLHKTAAAPRARLCTIEMVHGAAGSTRTGGRLHYWSPAQEGSDFEFTPSLISLKPYREYITIVSNTDLNGARPWSPKEEGADHTRSSAVYLTGAHPRMTEGADVESGPSIDQIYAQKFGQDTPLPSIQLCIENAGSLSAACGFGYSCVYCDTISWSSATNPLPMERDPRVVFERLFGAGGTAKERSSRSREDRSILDRIQHSVARLKQGLGPGDQSRLNGYLDNVREIERRIQAIEQYNTARPDLSHDVKQLPTAPVGVPETFREHVDLMFDLQVLAFMTETTRVSSFKMARDVSSAVYPESGVKAPFHSLSHHGEDPKNIAEFAKLNQYHVSTVAPFLEKLRNTPDGDGNLLDHSLVMYGSPMGDSHVHEHRRVPVFLAGHAAGKIKGNLHLNCPDETPMANLLSTIMHRLGVEDLAKIGDSTGDLAI
jgi:Protein of unknown function (DUF1552)